MLSKRSLYIQQNSCVSAFETENSWIILSTLENSIKNKIEKKGIPLKKWNIRINYGIKTGCNDAFVISNQTRQNILLNCKTEEERLRTDELIRPILRGRDIKRYGHDWANLWLIATFPSRHYDIELYPAVKEYLLDFGKERLEQTGKEYLIDGVKIKSRKKTGNNWFETQDQIGYWEDFSQQKIMYPNMTKYLPFYFDEKGFFQNDKSFMITGKHIAFLTAFLNSSLFKYCFKENFPELLGGTRELRKIFFDKIPVIKIDDKIEKHFQELICSIQDKYSIEKAKKIDEEIFDLYGLTKQEKETIGFIEIQ